MPLPNISHEHLVHFNCPLCQKWWSIGDAPERDHWFCPWCGAFCCHQEETPEQITEKYMKKVHKWAKEYDKLHQPEPFCPKCGSSDLHKKYRKKGEKLDERWESSFEKAPEELIRTTCRTCGYKWNVPVLERD